MNLKTLKDLMYIDDSRERGPIIVNVEELRDEINKHIEKLAEEINPPKTPSTPLVIQNQGIIAWAKDFFNIDDEDFYEIIDDL